MRIERSPARDYLMHGTILGGIAGLVIEGPVTAAWFALAGAIGGEAINRILNRRNSRRGAPKLADVALHSRILK